MSARHILIPFHDFARGGTERVALTLSRHWIDDGCHVTFLCGSRGGGTIDQVDPRARIVALDPELPRSTFSRLRLGKAMAPVLARIAPDVVFIPGNFHFVLAPAFRRAMPEIVMVGKVSNPLLPDLPGPLMVAARHLLSRICGPLDAMAFMAPELAEQGRPLIPACLAAPVIAEPNLPAGFKAPARKGPSDPPLILAIARLEPQKNLALALEAFARLRARRPATLEILGEGAERARLEALARRLGIGADVAMPGYVDDIPERLSRASALLLSSRYEGYPAVVVEALAADVPVVATACTPTLGALIDRPIRGEIVTGARPDALAEALSRALDLPFATHGERAAGVAHHDAAASARSYLDLFDELALGRSIHAR